MKLLSWVKSVVIGRAKNYSDKHLFHKTSRKAVFWQRRLYRIGRAMLILPIKV